MSNEKPYEIEEAGDATVVRVLTSSITPEAAESLIGYQVPPGGARVVLDLSRLRFLGSVGLSVLVVYLKRIHERKGRLAVAGLDALCRQTIATAGLEKVLNLYDDVPAALSALSARR